MFPSKVVWIGMAPSLACKGISRAKANKMGDLTAATTPRTECPTISRAAFTCVWLAVDVVLKSSTLAHGALEEKARSAADSAIMMSDGRPGIENLASALTRNARDESTVTASAGDSVD